MCRWLCNPCRQLCDNMLGDASIHTAIRLAIYPPPCPCCTKTSFSCIARCSVYSHHCCGDGIVTGLSRSLSFTSLSVNIVSRVNLHQIPCSTSGKLAVPAGPYCVLPHTECSCDCLDRARQIRLLLRQGPRH